MLAALTVTAALAASDACPIPAGGLWAHYADEWGHDEAKPAPLHRRAIKLGAVEAEWMYLKASCTPRACDVTFVRKLPNGCWHPLLSVQGRLVALRKGDWSSFTQTYTSSAVNPDKARTVRWTFDAKELKFSSQLQR